MERPIRTELFFDSAASAPRLTCLRQKSNSPASDLICKKYLHAPDFMRVQKRHACIAIVYIIVGWEEVFGTYCFPRGVWGVELLGNWCAKNVRLGWEKRTKFARAAGEIPGEG
jgi:hypothetical protein